MGLGHQSGINVYITNNINKGEDAYINPISPGTEIHGKIIHPQ
jgi:hypothetical protein